MIRLSQHFTLTFVTVEVSPTMEDVAVASLLACAIGLVILANHVQLALFAGTMVIAGLWWLKHTRPPPDLVGFEETKHGSTEPQEELFLYQPRYPIVVHYAAVWVAVPRRRYKYHRGIDISPPVRVVD